MQLATSLLQPRKKIQQMKKKHCWSFHSVHQNNVQETVSTHSYWDCSVVRALGFLISDQGYAELQWAWAPHQISRSFLLKHKSKAWDTTRLNNKYKVDKILCADSTFRFSIVYNPRLVITLVGGFLFWWSVNGRHSASNSRTYCSQPRISATRVKLTLSRLFVCLAP